MTDTRERRYRRLLALYPRDHRQRHGEEMLGVLMTADGGWRDGLDLVGGAVMLHLRRVFGLDGSAHVRDVMSIVSLLGPIVMLTGAVADLHEMAWWAKRGGLAEMPVSQVPDGPAWALWTVVAVLALVGLRRTAAVAAWLATGAHAALMSVLSTTVFWRYENAGWLLLGLFTSIALTWSPGPVHGKEFVGTRGILTAFAGVAVAALVVAVTPRLLAVGTLARQAGPFLTYGAMALGGHLAVRRVRNRRTARRAVFVLALPAITLLLDMVLVAVVGPPLFWTPAVDAVLFFVLPALAVLAGNGVLRAVRTRQPS